MSIWQNKRVFITGVSGFVGGALSRYLLKSGAHVVGLVHDIQGVMGETLASTYVIGDVTDTELMRQTIAKHEIDVVFHLAAYAIVRVSARDPMTCYNTNIMGTVSLLEACRTVGRCQAIVVASSDKAYGDHDELPYLETHSLQPLNTYDTSKACMDMIARSYAHNYDMPIAVTRCSNIYGPGDRNLSRLIPNTISRIDQGLNPVLYSDVENMEREFIFIDDVVMAYDLIAERLIWGDALPNLKGLALNIGGSGPQKMRDVVELIVREMGSDLKPVIVSREPIFQEIVRQYIDASLLEGLTGWKPRTSLVDGIRKTIPFYTNGLVSCE